MVNFVTLLVSAAMLSSRVMAGEYLFSFWQKQHLNNSDLFLSMNLSTAPIPDSSINEPGVRSPDGSPVTDASPAPTDKPNANYYQSSSSMMMMESSSSMMMDKGTSTMMMEETTTKKMMDDTTTQKNEYMSTSSMMMEETTTAAPSYATSTMSYGSGYTNWNSGYDGCVQRESFSTQLFQARFALGANGRNLMNLECMNTYGAPPAMYTAPPSTTTATDSGNGGGSGTTHTVIVAPAQG